MSLTRVRRSLLMLPLFLVGASSYAATIGFQVTSLSTTDPTLFRYTYTVTDFTFQANQELDIFFPASLYSQLTNGIASPDFDLLIFQPNNPPGSAGDYSAFALRNNPAITTFSVDFKFLGVGLPGSQSFEINQFSSAGAFLGTLASGTTVPPGGPAVPEPGSLTLCGLTVAVGAAIGAKRRRSRAA